MKALLVGILLFTVQVVHAEFKENRDQLGKSTFTSIPLINVPISTAGSIVRSITFSGAAPSTVAIYNTQLFVSNVTTRTLIYWPGGQLQPITIDLDMVNSSGTMIYKVGEALTTVNWDWYTRPLYSNPLNFGN